MTMSKYRRLINALCISAVLGASVSSCSEQEETDVSPLMSDTEITVSVPEWIPIVQSRAVLYEEYGNLLDVTKGGGNFTLYAYLDSDAKTYINGVRTWYFHEFSEWVTLDSEHLPRKYYWPNADKLNFFAFMPNKKYNGLDGYTSEDTHVTVLSYTKDKGQQFECNLPTSAGEKVGKTQEFIYAYETGQTKTKEPVKLKFHHPFAMVNFKLAKGSYRMTINDFKFKNIYLNGIFSTLPTPRGEWEPKGDPQLFTAEINKRIPNDINYNSNLYLTEWFIVMPQDLENVKLVMSADRTPDNPTAGSGTSITGTYTFGSGAKWEPGQKYTYLISYGNNEEEIYFNVEVEQEWIKGYEQNINVE